MGITIEALPDSWAELGEAPHWDIEEQCLYYVDIVKGTLLRYDFQTGKIFRAQLECEDNPGFLIPVEGEPGKFAVGAGHRVVIVSWDGIASTAKIERTLFEVQLEEKFKENRLNDGKCDARGRLFAGTYFGADPFGPHRYGELFQYAPGGQVSVVKSDVGVSNGLAWNEKAGKFYYIDTTDHEVKEYDYDVESGSVGAPKVVLDLRKSDPKDHLQPDGMTIDSDGNLYVALFNGHSILKVQPSTGKILHEIKFPCKQITSVAFGGPNLDILFVTTAAIFDQPTPAGTTYKVTGLGAKGLPMHKMRI